MLQKHWSRIFKRDFRSRWCKRKNQEAFDGIDGYDTCWYNIRWFDFWNCQQRKRSYKTFENSVRSHSNLHEEDYIIESKEGEIVKRCENVPDERDVQKCVQEKTEFTARYFNFLISLHDLLEEYPRLCYCAVPINTFMGKIKIIKEICEEQCIYWKHVSSGVWCQTWRNLFAYWEMHFLQWMTSNLTELFEDWEMHFLAVDDVKPNWTFCGLGNAFPRSGWCQSWQNFLEIGKCISRH